LEWPKHPDLDDLWLADIKWLRDNLENQAQEDWDAGWG